MFEINSIKPSEIFRYNKHPITFYTEYSPFPLFCNMVESYDVHYMYHCVASSVDQMNFLKNKKISSRDVFFSKKINYIITVDIGFDVVRNVIKMSPKKIPGEFMPRENLYIGDYS